MTKPDPQALPTGVLPLPGPEHPEHALWLVLEGVHDPEIPVVSLREMGILRSVEIAVDGVVEVTITPTYSGCPAMRQMEDDVVAALAAKGWRARVLTRIAPAWSTDWMSDEARHKLRAWGIAPPASLCAGDTTPQNAPAGASVVQFARRTPSVQTVPCPQCGSTDTTEISHFGSTACKALYRCLTCMEPFDYFKPY